MNGAISTIYQDKAGEWRWNVKSANGEIVAASTEGYANKQDAIANYDSQKELP